MFESLSFELIATIAGITLLVYMVSEFVFLAFIVKKAPFRSHFSMPIRSFLLIGLGGAGLGRVAPVIAIAGLATVGAKLTPISLGNEWYVWILALLIYEFWYWVQHFLAHKVRLFWCIHSPHHAPGTMNMFVGANHHVLEALLYFPIFLGFIPALCGIPPEIVFVLSTVDAIYGSFLHISADVVSDKRSRYGPLKYFLQTPSYHRAHHAKNVRYMDTNYNSITLFWDWALGTLEPWREDEPVDYGITRDVNTESFIDVHFGEFSSLWREVKAAPGMLNKLAYLFMPPGWSHTGDHQTTAMAKRQLATQEAM